MGEGLALALLPQRAWKASGVVSDPLLSAVLSSGSHGGRNLESPSPVLRIAALIVGPSSLLSQPQDDRCPLRRRHPSPTGLAHRLCV